jgi:hypothetical protein
MAEAKIQGAIITLTADANTVSATSDANGIAKVKLATMTEQEYNRLTSISARGDKSGYEQAVAQLTAMPSYEVASGNGISIRLPFEKYSASGLNITPTTLIFPTTGGTMTITVSAPDSLWSMMNTAIHTGVEAQMSGNVITVTCPSGQAEDLGVISVTWGNQTRTCYISRTAETTVGNVVVRGSVTAINTGGAVSGATVVLKSTSNTGATTTIAQGVTASDGTYSLTWAVDSATWGEVSELFIEAEKTGYALGVASTSTIPTFDTATAIGVAMPTVSLTDQSEEFGVSPLGVIVYAGGGSQTYSITGTDGSWTYSVRNSGHPEFIQSVTPNRTNNTLTITLSPNTGGVEINYYIDVTYGGNTITSHIIFSNSND